MLVDCCMFVGKLGNKIKLNMIMVSCSNHSVQSETEPLDAGSVTLWFCPGDLFLLNDDLAALSTFCCSNL
jgi:hypothetical protein